MAPCRLPIPRRACHVAGLAAINAGGVYSQLVAAHLGDRVTATSSVETETSALTAPTEVQSHTVADLDNRLGQIDAAIGEMVMRPANAVASYVHEARATCSPPKATC
jgi:hypothetical protein